MTVTHEDVRALIAGGGTAGHVHPGLALGRELRTRGVQVAFAGTAQGVESRLVPAAGFAFHEVEAQPLPRRVSPSAVTAPAMALRATRRFREVVSNVDVVVGMGGYVSVPPVLAAWRERVPVVLHEQNAVPGLANRLLARMARAVALSFPEAQSGFPRGRRVAITGTPVREEVLQIRGAREALAGEGRSFLGLEAGRTTVLIFGGSQGALRLDRAAVDACRLLADRSDLQVVLITGPAHLDLVRRALPDQAGLIVRVLDYLARMDLAYACADVVVARAGASTVAELSVCGLPAILVPYPYATGGHQTSNARALQRAGGASVILDDRLSGASLAERVRSLVEAPDQLRAMAGRSAAYGRPDAAPRLADLVIEVADSENPGSRTGRIGP